MAKTIAPPAGAEAKQDPDQGVLPSGGGLDMEGSLRQELLASAMREIASDGVDLADEFQPDPEMAPKPVKIHPKANFFPDGMEPQNMRQRPPKPYMSSYPEVARLQVVVKDQVAAKANAQKKIIDARKGSEVAKSAIAEAEKAVASAGDDAVAKEKASRSLETARYSFEEHQRNGKKGIALLEAATVQLADAQEQLAAADLKARREALREQRWRNGETPLSREEEDVELGVVPLPAVEA